MASLRPSAGEPLCLAADRARSPALRRRLARRVVPWAALALLVGVAIAAWFAVALLVYLAER